MSNRIIFYLPMLFLLSAFQCDDEYNPDEIILENDLVSIEGGKKQFAVGDYMIINTLVDNQQITQDGKTIALKDYLFPDETGLDYSLALYKLDAANEEIPFAITNVQETEGMILGYEDVPGYFFIRSPFDQSKDKFSSKIAIKLEEPGSYVLNSGSSRNNFYAIFFELRGTINETIEMRTSIADADADGVYRFTVE